MLNTEFVDNLYASLPKERQQQLITMLFKNSKQTMNYFKRTKDISLSFASSGTSSPLNNWKATSSNSKQLLFINEYSVLFSNTFLLEPIDPAINVLEYNLTIFFKT